MIQTKAIENLSINAFEIDEKENGVLVLQHQVDQANQSSFGKCELELSLFLPYKTIEKIIKIKEFKSYSAFRTWIERVVVKHKSIHPLRDFVAKYKLAYEIKLE